MADDMRLLMHPDLRLKITEEAIRGVSERDPESESDQSVEITTKTTTRRPVGAEDGVSDEDGDSDGDASDASQDVSDSGASGSVGASVRSAVMPTRVQPKRTIKSILSEKHDLLFRMNRLMSRGGKQSRSMSASDTLEELRAEYERMQRELDTDASVKFQRSVLMSFATGLECLNTKFDFAGVRLDGWSDSLNQDISSYDEVFEELHEKWGGKSMMPPELKLVFMVASSAFMFHMSKSVIGNMPGMQDILRDDPELARAVAAAAARKASTSNDVQPEMRGPANMFANILGSGSGARGKPMTMPDQDGVEQLFSDSETGSSAASVSSSSSESRSTKSSASSARKGRAKGRRSSPSNNEFILDA